MGSETDVGLELRMKAAKKGKLVDEFNERSPYWLWRVDNRAGIELHDSILMMHMGPTEALYYSNAEISDGLFEELPWRRKILETKVRLVGRHYGSAGWGFWNHTMVTDVCYPIWFIYLRSRGAYPFQGLFAQVGSDFQPIFLFEKNFQLMAAYFLSKISKRLAQVKIHSSEPSMHDLDIEMWHVYRIEWGEGVKFYLDGREVASVAVDRKDVKGRVDLWIDNAVFISNRGDAGKVYRHVTQENSRKATLEVDYVRVQ